MLELPQRWFRNVVRLQERRAYSCLTILCFTGFVAAVRLLEEWALGLRPVQHVPGRLLQFFAFYWTCFFSYTAALRVVVPQPWRKTANVVLIGIFLGILPPLIDRLAGGPAAVRYEYAWLADWRWWIYCPAIRLPLGESLVLWATILLFALYVFSKTRSALRATLGLLLAYAVVLFNASALFTAAASVVVRVSPKATLPFDMTNWHLSATLLIYLALQRELARGLFLRLNHALPFGLIFLAGAAFVGPLDPSLAAHALLLLLGFSVAIVQNDFFDSDDDAPQGRRRYVDRQDVAFFDATFAALILNFLQYRSMVAPGLLVFFVVSVLYNHPAYRAKAYFPSNLKIEGVWGLSACFLGVVAALERSLPVAHHGLAAASAAAVARTFDGATLVLLLLVFGGWTLVASLKDYKDLRADLRAGVRTLYTLAVRRRWGLRRTHAIIKLAACCGLLLPLPLLSAAGRVPLRWAAGGALASLAVFRLMSAAPSARRFEWTLAAINGYLAYVLTLLLLYPRR